MRTPLLAATLPLLCLLTAHATGQFDPDAVEPITPPRGAFYLGGGGDLPEEVYAAFARRARGEDGTLVLVAPQAVPDAAIAAWKKRGVGTVRGATFAQAHESLRKATAAWILGTDGDAFVATGQKLERALQALIARGGVIGCNGPIARTMCSVRVRSGKTFGVVGKGFDLIPGAVIEDDFTRAQRRHRMLGVLAASPTLVGLGIDADTALLLERRWIDVLGKGSGYGIVIGSDKRVLRIDPINREVSPISQRRGRPRRSRPARRRPGRSIRPRRLSDLVALSRSAHARVAKTFAGYDITPPKVAKGTLVIVGGGGMPRGLLQKFIELAGGPEAPIVYVPCDEREEIRGEPRILTMFRRAGAKNVDWIHTKDRKKANTDPEILGKLRKARGLWFGGGRQWNFVDSYQHTKAHELMQGVLARGGVIGGSSAGASIQGSYMVRGNSLGNLDPMAEGYEEGLGFLTGVAIDQHFTQRGRLKDMTALMRIYPKLLGIGLDEAASIIVQGTVATAFCRAGRDVLIYDRRRPVVPGQPDYVRLKNGERFDLNLRKRITADQPAKNEPSKSEKIKRCPL